MKASLEGLQRHLHNLEPRERRVLGGGVALVLVCACILLLGSAWQKRQTLLSGIDIVSEELVWMQEQAELLARMDKHCDIVLVADESAEARLRTLAGWHGIDLLQLRDSGGGRYNLRLGSVNGNALLGFVHESVCEGFELSTLTVRAAARDGAQEDGQLDTQEDAQEDVQEMPVTATLELVHAY